MRCVCSVCEAIDADTRALVLRSGVHVLFISILTDSHSPISQKLLCADKLSHLSFDGPSCDLITTLGAVEALLHLIAAAGTYADARHDLVVSGTDALLSLCRWWWGWWWGWWW